MLSPEMALDWPPVCTCTSHLPLPPPSASQCPTPHCAECQNVTGVCLQCEPGYGLVGGGCQKCKQGDRVEQTDSEGFGVTTILPLCEK